MSCSDDSDDSECEGDKFNEFFDGLSEIPIVRVRIPMILYADLTRQNAVLREEGLFQQIQQVLIKQ